MPIWCGRLKIPWVGHDITELLLVWPFKNPTKKANKQKPTERPGHQHHELISDSVTLSWNWANQFLPCPNNAEYLARKRQLTEVITNRSPGPPHSKLALYRFDLSPHTTTWPGAQSRDPATWPRGRVTTPTTLFTPRTQRFQGPAKISQRGAVYCPRSESWRV